MPPEPVVPLPRLHACRPDQEDFLLRETRKVYPASSAQVVAQGFVSVTLDPADAAVVPCIAFSQQCLPDAVLVDGESISTLAAAAWAVLAPHAELLRPGFVLHTGCHDFPGSPVRQARVDRVAQALPKLMGALASSRRPVGTRDVPLVQVVLLTPTQAAVSVATVETRQQLRRVLAPFPMGLAPVTADARAPSRAHLKLREALLFLDTAFKKSDVVVDLGASPGGWSFDALAAGATVFAIDRSPLRADLMANPRLRFVKGDAFAWEPKRPVDWLVCDVIAFPQKTLPLLRTWLRNGWCKRFVVSIKFKGQDDYPVLEEARRMLDHHAQDFLIRQVQANKNEVTAMGVARHRDGA